MKTFKRMVVLALVAAMPMLAHAAGQAQGKTLTVGEFAVMLSKAADSSKPVDAAKAVDSLAQSGVPLGDSKRVLDERTLAKILDYYGVKATSSKPDQAVTPSRAKTAVGLVTSAMQSGASATAASSVVPQTLDDCLVLSNHGQCTNCCKSLGGAPSTCSKTCFAINKPSAGEPLP